MQFFPAFVKLKNRDCLVVGGDAKVAAVVTMILKSEGRVLIVADRLSDAVAALVDNHQVNWRAGEFRDMDLMDKVLVFVAGLDIPACAEIIRKARLRNIPVNVSGSLKMSDFEVPEIIERPPITVAVANSGELPVLTKIVRNRIDNLLPKLYGRLALMAGEFKQKVEQKFSGSKQAALWESLLQGPFAELVFNGQEKQARQLLQQRIQNGGDLHDGSGVVYLVGGGPGDPELLTLKALRLMQQCDVVVYDRLIAPGLLALVNPDAERVYVGKEVANHPVPQEDINQLLVRLARLGKRVLRLKGGDPFIFGRGGEEIQILADEGIPFHVVPGVTSASGCSTYAGIPLTHRDYAQSCVFVTGHLKDGSLNLNWQALAQENQTTVFYMGIHGAGVICRKLIENGRAPQTPAAVVEKGTTPEQRVFTGTLDDLPEIIKRQGVRSPALIIIGEVVELHRCLGKQGYLQGGKAVDQDRA